MCRWTSGPTDDYLHDTWDGVKTTCAPRRLSLHRTLLRREHDIPVMIRPPDDHLSALSGRSSRCFSGAALPFMSPESWTDCPSTPWGARERFNPCPAEWAFLNENGSRPVT